MEKVKLMSGEIAFKISIHSYVSKTIFAQAICENFYSKNYYSLPVLSKKQAKEILRDRLRFHGVMGCYHDADNIGDDNIDQYNNLYNQAEEWVKKNYEFLNK